MSVVDLPWASWMATLLGCAVAALLAFAVDRCFRDTQAVLLAPIAWMLGSFLGAAVAVYALSTIGNWNSSGPGVTIIETSWLQKILLVLLAPAGGVIASRFGVTRSSTLVRTKPSRRSATPGP